jgi:hypothetical protein
MRGAMNHHHHPTEHRYRRDESRRPIVVARGFLRLIPGRIKVIVVITRNIGHLLGLGLLNNLGPGWCG